MRTSRLHGWRGDGSTVVRRWVAIYTFGLPAPIRERRRGEVAGDLADEALDAVRRGETAGLRRRRIERWIVGIPDDLAWRLIDAPADVRALRVTLRPTPWIPVSRLAMLFLGVAAIGAAGGLTIMIGSVVNGRSAEDTWTGWGPYGFMAACAAALVAILLAVPWPRRGLALGVVAVAVGLAASPWLAGCWLLILIALVGRWHEARADGAVVP